MNPPAKLLTIAGSDSGGAAGLQADLRAWAVLGGYGMSVVTAPFGRQFLDAPIFFDTLYFQNVLNAGESDGRLFS